MHGCVNVANMRFSLYFQIVSTPPLPPLVKIRKGDRCVYFLNRFSNRPACDCEFAKPANLQNFTILNLTQDCLTLIQKLPHFLTFGNRFFRMQARLKIRLSLSQLAFGRFRPCRFTPMKATTTVLHRWLCAWQAWTLTGGSTRLEKVKFWDMG